ncbi:hypothetical protein RCL1_006396 [Eukaryota sp. TZLM3-RCL]
MTNTIIGSEFPVGADGSVYHLGVKKGEVAPRILTVGCVKRAEKFAGLFLDPGFTAYSCDRKFAIFTGTRRGVACSVVGSLMGYPNMDFVVRESRYVIDGPMAIVRLGTSGTPRDDVPLGTVALASQGCVGIIRNPDAFGSDSSASPYLFTNTVPPTNDKLIEACRIRLKERVGDRFREGVGASACSFYSAQGRVTAEFEDRNSTVLDQLLEKEPRVVNLEMETFHLYDLARICKKSTIAVAGAAIVIAQRTQDQFIDMNLKEQLENLSGEACMDALVDFVLE